MTGCQKKSIFKYFTNITFIISLAVDISKKVWGCISVELLSYTKNKACIEFNHCGITRICWFAQAILYIRYLLINKVGNILRIIYWNLPNKKEIQHNVCSEKITTNLTSSSMKNVFPFPLLIRSSTLFETNDQNIDPNFEMICKMKYFLFHRLGEN